MFNLLKNYKNTVKRQELTITDLNDDWVMQDFFIKDYVLRQDKHIYEQLWKLETEILKLRGILLESGILEEAETPDVCFDEVGYVINSVDDLSEIED